MFHFLYKKLKKNLYYNNSN